MRRRSSRIVAVLFLAVFVLSNVRAQDFEQPKQYKILGISIEGNKSAETAAVIANTGLKIGEDITVPGEQTRTAINRLWDLRIFSDIQITVEKTVGNGAYLLITVKENPRLEKVEFSGNDELSESDLTKKVSLLKGQIVSPQEVSRLVGVLKKAYDDEGYLEAEIKPELLESPDTNARGRVILRFNIHEGPEVRIGSILFYGNKAFSDGDLRGEMDDTHEHVWWKFWRSSKFDKKKYADDKKKILDFYHKNGYRDAAILTDSISYSDDNRDMNIRIFVYEGPQYRVRNITWEGNTVFKTEALNQRLGFQRGDVYNLDTFDKNLHGNEDQTDVASLYLDNGYLTSSLDPEEIKVGQDSVDIVIHVRERNQFRIAQVIIRGNTKTEEKVIRRELRTRPGDYFSRSNIIRSVRQLSVLNYFNPEKIKPDTRFVDDTHVDVIYDVEEKSSDTFNMSVGYSGVFGFTGALGLTFNNFALYRPLSGGGGQILNFDWEFGEGSRYRTFSISFREPWLFGTRTSLGFSIFDTRQNYYYDYRTTGGSISLGRQFKWPDDYTRGDWTFQVQKIDNYTASAYYGNPGLTTQFSLTQVLSRNSVNSPLFPTDGSSIALSTELSGPPFLPGSAEFTKHILSVDWYIPVFNNSRFALYLGSQYGEIFRFRKNTNIPSIEYFYMGGTGLGLIATTPLRGYDDRSVGPRDVYGNVLPGTVMEKETAELRFNVSLNPIPIYLLAFAEAGNVWSGINRTELFDLRRSAGVGARLQINPIGLLGFDYGFGFDNPAGIGAPSGWHFHFQFGRGF
ncbi:MAG: outer membrane protein assembly factor BamA [Bacteroidota bacterium]|nr:outer membrane protein assembly factor BamA [Bacteroidota bacterium]